MPRLVDRQIDKLLSAFGAVEIVGSRWCGKTWTAMAHGESIVHIDDPQTKAIAEADPLLILEGERPHIVDEWQEVPRIWDAARRSIDTEGEKGLFLLTGSSSLSKDEVTHSGAGRIARLRMRPMSLYESGESSGDVSLAGLFEGDFRPKAVSTDLRDIAKFVCRGGWPGALSLSDELHIETATQYLDTLLTISVPKNGKNENIARKLLTSLARNLGQSVTHKTIAEDMGKGEEDSDSEYTHYLIDTYLEMFEGQYFIENLKGWDAPIKSKSRLRTKPKRYFVDPSLTAATLSITPERLVQNMQLFGNLFEELCIRDLRTYAAAMPSALPEPLYYYRDSDDLEVDAIIELRDGRWGAIEIKLSEDKVEKATQNLIRLKNKILSNTGAQNSPPSFMAVIVGKTDFQRVTEDGIFVIPITSLKS
ncbi:MAG: DUF4143 domain-containing protein [Clostridiales Family XIII bacterium]|jgi:predicted AAA+ superfamily ATPase|nr:DUF4143 domain-containing protein [Clostridiales Family XIII bacterium]